jgi:sulfur-oxidizing protein SoxY
MLSRRNLLLTACAAALALAASPRGRADDSDDPWPDIKAALFGDRPIQDGAGIIGLEAPKRAYDAAIVPIRVTAEIPQANDRYIRAIHLIVDQNPAPVAGVFHFTLDSGSASFATRVRVNEYTYIRAIAEMNDGSLYMAAAFVKAAGGCSAPSLKDADKAMANLGRMKLRPPDSIVLDRPNEAQLLISHPNFSGMQFDQISRNYIPAHFVQDIQIRYGDRVIMTVEGNISLSEDPSVHFNFVPHGPGAIGVEVTDSAGMKFSQTWPVNPVPGS